MHGAFKIVQLLHTVDFLHAAVLEGISANFCGKFSLDFELPFAVDMLPPSVSETTSGSVSDGSTLSVSMKSVHEISVFIRYKTGKKKREREKKNTTN